MTATVGVTIVAGPLRATGNGNPTTGKQLEMKAPSSCFIHVTPEVARQWMQVLEPIAEEA